MADIERTVITSAQAPQPLGAYSLGMSVKPRKLVYLAGQVSVDADGTLVGKGMPQPRPGRLCKTCVTYYAEPVQISATLSSSPPT